MRLARLGGPEARAALRLDQRRSKISVWPDIDTTANFAVRHAVQEIDQQPDSQPDDKPNPGHHRQTQHQSETQQYPKDWENRNERHAKGTRPFRIDAAQHVYANANQNKRKECSDIRQVGEIADVCNHRHGTDDNSSPNRGDVWCAEARMNFGEVLR